MSSSTVVYRTAGPVATVLLNRPDSLNSFDTPMRADLAAALREAWTDPAIRVVVLGSEGRVFSAGADLKAGLPEDITIEQQLLKEYKPCFDAVTGMDKPVIAAVNGSASGIGASLALVSDLSVMAENAFFLAPFTTIGLVPDGGLTLLLSRQVGYQRAYQLCIECERLPAQRALELGLTNRLAAAGEATEAAEAWAVELAERAPISLAATKRAMRQAMYPDYDSIFRAEASLQNVCAASDDCAEGVAAFKEKRAPKFSGR